MALELFGPEGIADLEAEGLTQAEIDELATIGEPTLRQLMLQTDGRTVVGMLGRVENGEQLARLLGATGNNATMLGDFLRLSGAARGDGVAAEIEGVITFARTRGATAAECQGILDIANGDAARFRDLATQAKRFPSPRGASPNPQPTNLAGIGPSDSFSGADTKHFANRHTYEFFDVRVIRPNNSFFPEGMTPATIVADLEPAIDQVRAAYGANSLPMRGSLNVTVNGREYRIGWREMQGQRYVGQFYPIDTNPGVTNIAGNAMRAIARVIGP